MQLMEQEFQYNMQLAGAESEGKKGVETQKEHRLIALACADIINKVFPQKVWHKDWEWY